MKINKKQLFEKMVVEQKGALVNYFGVNDETDKVFDVKNFHIVAVNSDKVLTVLFNENCGTVMVYTTKQIINEFDNFNNIISLVEETFGFKEYEEIIETV